MASAIVEAAYDTLVDIYPNKKPLFDAGRTKSLPLIGAGASAKEVGARIGKAAAMAVLKLRELDGSDRPDLSADDFESPNPLDWRKDPVTQLGPALGGNWHRVRPFVVASADKYRPGPPPQANDPVFIAAFKDVKRLGGDPNADALSPRWPTPTERTGVNPGDALDAANETFKGVFCAPPRLYNMVATSIALNEQPVTSVEDFARLLALLNIAMADAGICAWEAKYHYAYARPVTAIRALDADDSTAGARDANWTPLGAPVSNGVAANRNLTPPFPAYPSGHATFGGAVFQILRRFWGTPPDGVPFDFVSDEYNGVNRGPGEEGPRPHVRRQFASFTEAETENAQSRIWLGIHWQFDADEGIAQGRKIGDDVFDAILSPVP